MTTDQLKKLYAELFSNLAIIAENEVKLQRLAIFLQKLVKENDDK